MCGVCGCSGERGHEGHDHVHDHDHPHAHSHSHAHEHPHEPLTEQTKALKLELDLLDKNDRYARESRALFARLGTVALNLMGAPGAGKTALLEATLGRMRGELPIAVLEGDQETDRDAARIRATGCPVLQINTGAGCHLDASMVLRALRELPLAERSLLFIENVGNLVCPALFDLGERAKVVVMSTTEGEDKPLKYPHMFRAADVLVLNKIDLTPYVGFDERACLANARRINPSLQVFRVAATKDTGLEEWCDWLRDQASHPASMLGKRRA